MANHSRQYHLTVSLIVKADNAVRAIEAVDTKIGRTLGEWFNEDAQVPPFPNGALLYYHTSNPMELHSKVVEAPCKQTRS